MISQHIWNYNFDTGTNIIDVYISHLRTKLTADRQRSSSTPFAVSGT